MTDYDKEDVKKTEECMHLLGELINMMIDTIQKLNLSIDSKNSHVLLDGWDTGVVYRKEEIV